jgi:hypothetical protein
MWLRRYDIDGVCTLTTISTLTATALFPTIAPAGLSAVEWQSWERDDWRREQVNRFIRQV